MVDANLVFEDLKAQASTRQAKSLTILNDVLKAQYAAGERNFSIAEISRLSTARGGPSASTIRNTTGLVFRQLIEAWAAKAGSAMKAPVNPHARGNKIPKDNELLSRLTDPALRAIFGQVIAERNRYRNELNTLRAQSEFVIDMRPVRPQLSSSESVQVLPSFVGVLNDMDIEALTAAIADQLFEKQCWTVTKQGQVKDENSREIYKHGYVNAIRKILKEIE